MPVYKSSVKSRNVIFNSEVEYGSGNRVKNKYMAGKGLIISFKRIVTKIVNVVSCLFSLFVGLKWLCVLDYIVLSEQLLTNAPFYFSLSQEFHF